MVVGVAMSMGSLLLTGGAKGKRMALPNSRILIHQPSAGFEGQATDIEIHAAEILKTRKRIDEIYSFHTGQPEEQVRHDMERDRFFKADHAQALHLEPDDVAGGEELRRVHRLTDALGRPGQHDVAGLERDRLREEVD